MTFSIPSIRPLLSLFLLISTLTPTHPFQNQTFTNSTSTRQLNIFQNSDASISHLRFSKIEFPNPEHGERLNLPLTKYSYPIKDFTAAMLKLSMCPSVTTYYDRELKYSIKQLIRKIGGKPSHPSQSRTNPFWKELRHVIRIQRRRKRYGDSTPASCVMPMPELWRGFSLNDAAEAVHDEYPGHHQTELIKSFLSNPTGIRIDSNVIKRRSYNQFLHGVVMLAQINTWAISKVGAYNFAAKYYVGRCRPEEIVWSIHTNSHPPNTPIPPDIITKIQKLNLHSPTDFTAYPEGCPMHPSWPAMHSAASSSSLWLSVVLNLTPRQISEAKKTDYAVAYARTIAGVHYPSDNIAGLKLGQEIVVRELPGFLEREFGSDPDKVREKIRRVRFDWDEFDGSGKC